MMYILTTLEFPTHNIDFHLIYVRCLEDLFEVKKGAGDRSGKEL